MGARTHQSDVPGEVVLNGLARTLPAVSLVIPLRNEEKYIEGCLESLLAQDHPRVIEIMVVDGMSDDGTRRIVVGFQAQHPTIRLLNNPDKVQTFALNKGVAGARGDVIVRIDAHALYESDYVSQCVHYLVETGAGNVGGPAVPRIGDSYQSQIIAFAHESRFGIGVARFRQSSYEGYADTVWPGAFWKRVFDEIGGFRGQLARSEDVDWNARLRQRGYKVFITPKIRACYFPRCTLRGLAEQSFRNGNGISQSLFANWRSVSLRHLVPLLSLITTLCSIVAAFFTPFAGLALVGILGSYSALCLLFGAQTAWKRGLKYLPAMPVVFLTIHSSYGVGSLWGLLKFGVIKRWHK